MVDLRAVGERGGQVPLQGLQFWFEGAYAAVELALADEVGEVSSEAHVSEAPEVPLASETRPLGEDGER